jgi:hypothetical protein
MRRILWAFVILSPFVAFAQSYRLTKMSVADDVRMAPPLVTHATVQLADTLQSICRRLG